MKVRNKFYLLLFVATPIISCLNPSVKITADEIYRSKKFSRCTITELDIDSVHANGVPIISKRLWSLEGRVRTNLKRKKSKIFLHKANKNFSWNYFHLDSSLARQRLMGSHDVFPEQIEENSWYLLTFSQDEHMAIYYVYFDINKKATIKRSPGAW